MQRSGLWLRVFVALLLAVLPPLLLLVGAVLLTDTLLAEADPNLVAVFVVVGAIVWGAILAVPYTRSLADDLRSFLTLAERGEALRPDTGTAQRQVAEALAERNDQIAALARETGLVPIDEEPEHVVRAIVSATRSVTRDPTWRCAVVASDGPDSLAPGVYLGLEDEADSARIGDLEQWVSMTVSDASVAHADGPWGAFVVVHLSGGPDLRAVLYAPWEGRGDPSAAERAVLTLVGQHAGTALEHSLLYRRVRTQADELNRLAALQADFLRGVTHDLQTPLTSIGALATELRADDGIPDSARSDLDTITHQAERLRRMVGQLLISSRLEAGAYTPQLEVFAVRPLIERTWQALRSDRPFRVRVSGPPHLAVGDPDRFEQVLWAVLDNAVKYSPPESPVAVDVAQGDGRISVTVRDRGTGMDAEARARAFDQFYRSPKARQLAPDGSGVGLYAARGLVEAMGGSIDVRSALGEGTELTVRLPAEPSGGGA